MAPELPSDMMFEILSIASLQTLHASRCVSKELQKLTYNSTFLDLHAQRNNIVSGFLVQSIRRCVFFNEFAASHGSRNLDLSFLPYNSRIVASSEQGIVVLECRHPKHHRMTAYHVCKPSTRQIVALPNPKTRYPTEKFAIVVLSSTPLQYKIIRLSRPKHSVQRHDEHYVYRCEIFDSVKWGWGEVDLVSLPYGVLANSHPISTRGCIYMLLANEEVLRFDVNSERWSRLSLPKSDQTLEYPFEGRKELVKYEGKLGLACRAADDEGWELWVAAAGNEGRWELRHVIKEEESTSGESDLVGMCDSDASLMQDVDMLVFYKFKEAKNVKKVQMKEIPYQIFVFRSDLEPVNLKAR